MRDCLARGPVLEEQGADSGHKQGQSLDMSRRLLRYGVAIVLRAQAFGKWLNTRKPTPGRRFRTPSHPTDGGSSDSSIVLVG